MIQGQFTNGVFSGVKLSALDVVTGSLGMEDGNLNVNLSLSLFGHTIGANVGVGKNGVTASAGADNGKRGYDVGMNLNLDFQNGIVGAYVANRNISAASNGITTTQTTETGFRVGNLGQLVTVGAIVTSPVWVPVLAGKGLVTGGVIAGVTAISIIVNQLIKK